MHIERDSSEIINLKRIARIKTKFGLITKKRKKTNMKNIMLNDLEHKIVPNLLQQNFNVAEARKVFSTDVTFLINKKGQRAYLSAVKDLGTKEIVGFEVSKTNNIEFVIKSVRKSIRGIDASILTIHSDQGFQYTHESYQGYLKTRDITQSMSRRGNCLDNAPIESFFGHLKDETDYKNFKNLEDLNKMIEKYIKFYNEKRPQWGLQRRTPVEYRSSLR
jgi:transposase InsO family protein